MIYHDVMLHWFLFKWFYSFLLSSYNVGMFFWDYGNAFLLEARRAGADVDAQSGDDHDELQFRYPSYVQDIMG